MLSEVSTSWYFVYLGFLANGEGVCSEINEFVVWETSALFSTFILLLNSVFLLLVKQQQKCGLRSSGDNAYSSIDDQVFLRGCHAFVVGMSSVLCAT